MTIEITLEWWQLALLIYVPIFILVFFLATRSHYAEVGKTDEAIGAGLMVGFLWPVLLVIAVPVGIVMGLGHLFLIGVKPPKGKS